jgi:uncharacterized GH25 family protein
MTRFFLSAAAALALAVSASAHFVFVVPAKDAKTIQVVMSEDLDPDADVPVEKIAATKLTVLTADGKTAPVAHTKGKDALTATLPADARLVYGTCAYGVMTKGGAKPYLLAYHPKAVLAGCDEKAATLGAAAAAEIVPVGTSGKMAVLALAAGKPVADAEVNVMLPDGTKEKAKTDAAGKTKPFTATGRYGAWAKVNEAKAGEFDGQKYDEIRHYATVVADVK